MNHFQPTFILYGALFLAACTAIPWPTLPGRGGGFEDARQRVLDEVIRPESVDHRIILFGLGESLQPGDEIRPYPMENYKPVPASTAIEDETWFFWIDDAPGAYFVHPNRFVFVPASGGEITVQEQEWWPELNGQGLWIDSQEYWDPENWAWSNLPVPQSAGRPRGHGGPLAAPGRAISYQGGGNNWGVVINGWAPGETLGEEMASDATAMKDLLTTSGFRVNHLGPGGEGSAALSSSTFDALAQIQQPGDTLLVFVNGHGWDESGNGRVGPITESDLRAQLEKINPGVHIIVIVAACHSGTFRDGLQDVADVTITNTSNLDLAYSDADPEPHGVEDPNPEDKGGEYLSGFREDWSEIMADPAQQEAARARARGQGTGFYEEMAALSHVSATEKDATALAGWTFPGLTRGSARTRPVVLQDGSGDGVSCGTGTAAEGLNPAADLGLVEAFSTEGQLGFRLTFPGVTNIASAVSALPPDGWAVNIRFLHPNLPTAEFDPAEPFSSLQNEIYRIVFNHPTQGFRMLVASFTGEEWIGASPVGTGVYPIGPSLEIVIPGHVLDDGPQFFFDTFDSEICDNLPDLAGDPGEFAANLPMIGSESIGERQEYPGLDTVTSIVDPVDDGLDCRTGDPLEGLPPEGDLGGLQVLASDTTILIRLAFSTASDLSGAAMAAEHPVRVGVSFLHPEGVLPSLDPALVFASSQNEYMRIEWDAQTASYRVQVQALGPSGWTATPGLGLGALTAGGVLEIVRPRSGVSADSRMYVATFTETACDAIGFEDGAAALPVLPP